MKISGRGAVGSARGSGLRGRQFKSGRPDHCKILLTLFKLGTDETSRGGKRQFNLLPISYIKITGLGAVVARTSGGREVASSTLVAPTIHLNSVLEIIRLLL